MVRIVGASRQLIEGEYDVKATWREIMLRAENARVTMLKDRLRGEQMFDNLLTEYPNDGMIYYKRGEALEALGELRKPLSISSERTNSFQCSSGKKELR